MSATEQLGPRTLQSLALVAEVVHGAPTRFEDPARFAFAHGGKDGHIKGRSPLAGYTDRLHGMARLDAFTRASEARRGPGSDVAAAIDHERRISPSLGGRTVFDDRSRRPRPDRGQLDLF
ncbi:MAG TPA: DUF763 domain-containing protein [Vicinamibacterales bacterium]|nr:DUF763 domain-containing protein [Vicinamibacterales bacterium]